MSQSYPILKPNRLEQMRKASGPLVLLALMLLLVWFLVHEGGQNYRWQWYRVWRYLGSFGEHGFQPGPLLSGLRISLQLIGGALLLSLAVGAVICVMRLSASPVARLLGLLIINLVRNTPLLMQLFLVYFVAAPLFGFSQFTAALLALAVFEGAYLAEVFRAGVSNLPKAQWEAAFSLGFGLFGTLRLVILPQALPRVIAPLANQLVSLIKDSSLVSAIAVADLTQRARMVITDTFLSFEIWLLTAAIYLALTLMVSIPARLLEKRPQTRS